MQFVHLQSLVNVVEASIENGCHKIVFSSSCTVYGQPDQNPVSENAPLKKPESPYGNTKRICEMRPAGISASITIPSNQRWVYRQVPHSALRWQEGTKKNTTAKNSEENQLTSEKSEPI